MRLSLCVQPLLLSLKEFRQLLDRLAEWAPMRKGNVPEKNRPPKNTLPAILPHLNAV